MKTTLWGITVSIVLSGFLVYGLFNGLNILTVENQAPETFYGDSQIQGISTQLQGNTSTYLNDPNSALTVLSNSSVTQGGSAGQNIVFDSVSKFWKGLTAKPIAIYRIIAELGQRRLFGDYTIFNILLGIIALAIVISVIRLVTTGEGGGKTQ